MAQGSQSAPAGSSKNKNVDAFFDPSAEGDEDMFGEDFGTQALVGAKTEGEGNEESHEMDVSRDPGFYTSSDSVKISNKLWTRLFYHQDRCSFVVFFKKINDLTISNATDHTHMSVNPENIRSLWKAIQYVCDEVELTPYDKIPKSLEGEEERQIFDKDSMDYWRCAQWTDDRNIAVRSYKTASGSYLVRMMMKRPAIPHQKFPKWIGRSLSIKISEARAFVEALQMFEGRLQAADRMRIELAAAKQAERARLENEELSDAPAFENISPAPSP